MSKILQAGETGFGILIENDSGYISYEDNKQIISEGFEIKLGEPVLINCILQKWGVKNKNGRIYPKDVLMAQVDEYMKMVNGNSAISECFSPDTKILTKEGWKLIKNISENENILTLNTETNTCEYQDIIKKINFNHSGDMYHIKSTNIDIKVTPDHRFLVLDINNKLIELRASELFEDIQNNKYFNGKYKLLKKINWDVQSTNDFVFDKLSIKPELFYAFMGIYLSEGCTLNDRYLTQITQKKENIIIKIEELLIEMNFNFKKNVRKTGTVDFFIKNDDLFLYLKRLGKSYEKYIPLEIKNGSSDLLKVFIDWFQLGDGRNINYIRKGKKIIKNSVFSVSKKLIYDLHEVLYKSGRCGNITIDTKRNDRYIVDKKNIIEEGEEILVETKRLIERKNSKALFNLNLSNTEHIYLDRRMIKVKKYNYTGKVVCVQVPNETIFVMRNGKALWTKNCDHPDSSVISLQNVSHMITKMWWGEGDQENILYGQLKLIVSPGFVKYGVCSMIGDKIVVYLQNKIKLGISSRGVGSLKEVHGENLVQNDFELIGFDLVSTPSTPGAYLFPANSSMKEEKIQKKEQIYENKLIKAIDLFLD